MSDFGTASPENRSFAARRAENCKGRLQNNQFWNRLDYIIFGILCPEVYTFVYTKFPGPAHFSLGSSGQPGV
jgi:hypothetical protein